MQEHKSGGVGSEVFEQSCPGFYLLIRVGNKENIQAIERHASLRNTSRNWEPIYEYLDGILSDGEGEEIAAAVVTEDGGLAMMAIVGGCQFTSKRLFTPEMDSLGLVERSEKATNQKYFGINRQTIREETASGEEVLYRSMVYLAGITPGGKMFEIVLFHTPGKNS